jgi:hypothetical protein
MPSVQLAAHQARLQLVEQKPQETAREGASRLGGGSVARCTVTTFRSREPPPKRSTDPLQNLDNGVRHCPRNAGECQATLVAISSRLCTNPRAEGARERQESESGPVLAGPRSGAAEAVVLTGQLSNPPEPLARLLQLSQDA